jgi:hypothetical protein
MTSGRKGREPRDELRISEDSAIGETVKTISISGTLCYRFTEIKVNVPDDIDLDDEKALLEYLDGTIDYANVRQQSDDEFEIMDIIEERQD